MSVCPTEECVSFVTLDEVGYEEEEETQPRSKRGRQATGKPHSLTHSLIFQHGSSFFFSREEMHRERTAATTTSTNG